MQVFHFPSKFIDIEGAISNRVLGSFKYLSQASSNWIQLIVFPPGIVIDGLWIAGVILIPLC